MRRLLKVLLLFVLGIGLLIGIGLRLAQSPLPEGTTGPDADALARQMMEAIDDDAWQRTGAVSWDFSGRQQHLWDRERGLARVRFGDHEVLLDLTHQTGKAYLRADGSEIDAVQTEELVQKAWSFWCNDSFWLNPISKVFDEGVTRRLVELEDGGQGLLVTYSEGGVTPGDSYLWIVGPDGRPVAWKMWTRILPVAGLEAGWDGWQTLATGAQIATRHKIAFLELELHDVEGATHLAELVLGDDPFAPLLDPAP